MWFRKIDFTERFWFQAILKMLEQKNSPNRRNEWAIHVLQSLTFLIDITVFVCKYNNRKFETSRKCIFIKCSGLFQLILKEDPCYRKQYFPFELYICLCVTECFNIFVLILLMGYLTWRKDTWTSRRSSHRFWIPKVLNNKIHTLVVTSMRPEGTVNHDVFLLFKKRYI